MRILRHHIAALAVALCGCAADLQPMALSVADVAQVKQAVTRQLKDPESARFGPIVGGKDATGRSYACGVVNAKNSFGGYTGDKPFVVKVEDGPAGRTFDPIVIGGADVDTATASMACGNIL